jgi:cell division FtsZ-interacting protein ZapD
MKQLFIEIGLYFKEMWNNHIMLTTLKARIRIRNQFYKQIRKDIKKLEKQQQRLIRKLEKMEKIPYVDQSILDDLRRGIRSMDEIIFKAKVQSGQF